MTRHTSNRHNNKSNVAEWLPARQEPTSGSRTLSYWMTVMVGLLSVGLLWQRLRGVMPVNAASLSFTTVRLPHDDRQPSYNIQFPVLAPLLLSSAVTYQTGNSVVGMLSSLPLWFARPVAAQTPGVSIVVPEFRVNSNVTGAQFSPAVASQSNGEWLVVWEGYQTGGGNIYGSIFSSVAPLSTTASSTPSSSITTSILSTIAKSPVTTLASSTLSTSLSTTTNVNSVKTLATTTSLNPFTSPSSAGVSGTVTTATNQPSTTPPQTTATNANSGVSGVIIGAAVGGSVVGVAACLGIIGFYAYRKKSLAGQASHSAVSEVGTSLKTIEQTSAQPASEYAHVNLKDADQSDNVIPVSNSPYGRIDEMKKQEKEYDHAPTF